MASTLDSEIVSVRRGTWLWAAVFAGCVGVAEYILAYVSVPWGVVLYFVMLISSIVGGAFERSDRPGGLRLALGLVPIIRIVGIVVSLEALPAVQSYVLVGVPVLLGIYLTARRMKYGFDEIGLNRRHLWDQILTAVTGGGLGIIGFLILRPAPLVTGLDAGLILPALVLLVFTGFVEELAFRGLMQRAAGALGSRGWLLIAPVYALLQIGGGSLLQIAFALVVGLYFGLVVHRTRSVFGVSLAHGLLNLALFIIMPNLMM